jgi:hypothetical protein
VIPNAQFEVELRKLLAEEIDRLKENLARSTASMDYAEFRHIVGQIAALRRVVDSYCGEVDDIINKR